MRVEQSSVTGYVDAYARIRSLTDGALDHRDLKMVITPCGAELVAQSDRGRVFLEELDRLGGASPRFDAEDGTLTGENLVHVRQVAKKRSLGRAMMAKEILPLFQGVDAQRALLKSVDDQKDEMKAKRNATREQAAADIDALTEGDWAQSFFTADEHKAAVEARERELWTRTDRRKYRTLKLQKGLLRQIVELESAGASTPAEREALRALKVDFIELGTSAALNDRLGAQRQVIAGTKQFLRRWGILPRANQHKAKPAVDVADAPDTSALDPEDSRLWQPRSPESVTPEKLHAGPWWSEQAPPDPGLDETLELLGFRDVTADGMHPSVVCKDKNGDEVQVKMFGEERTLANGPISARLLWAMGFNTEGLNGAQRLRLEPRAVLAAWENTNKVVPGLRLPDDGIPGVNGPGRKIGYTGAPMSPAAIGAVHLKDGRTLTGSEAVAQLKYARARLKKGDRATLESIASVEVSRVDVEYDGPTSSIGPWHYDQLGHHERRDVRSLGIVFQSWLGAWDIKFNNVRLDVREREDGTPQVMHVVSDCDSPDHTKLDWKVGIDPSSKRLHPDNIPFDVQAPDHLRVEDAQWAIRKLGALSEEQILACVTSGTFDEKAGWEYFEKLLSRRDDLVRSFGLEAELGLLRPDGPRAFSPAWKGAFDII